MVLNSFPNINESDLQRLIDDCIWESREIDYKEEINLHSNKYKQEFLYDVTAFANTGPGYIVYGISEDKAEKGKPSTIVGIDPDKVDQLKNSMEQLIRDCIEPRLLSYVIAIINLQSSEKKIIIIRMEKSWIGPHMVTHDNKNRFYCRDNGGKHLMGVDEMRNAFNLGFTATETINKFRSERCEKIAKEFAPRGNNDLGVLIVHLIPIEAFVKNEINNMYRMDLKSQDVPYLMSEGAFFSTNKTRIFNFDGIKISPNGERQYTSIFRCGLIEGVETHSLGNHKIDLYLIEKYLHPYIKNCLHLMEMNGISPPIYLSVSIIKVKGFTIKYSDQQRNFDSAVPIDRDNLFLPDSIIENYQNDGAEIVDTYIDMLWNAIGYPRNLVKKPL
jgi:hypothetical protein